MGDERTTLIEALRCQRLTLQLQCAGLDAEAMARRAVEPSTMSLLGLVRHLAEGERDTFRVMMAGRDAAPVYRSDNDRDADFDGAVADPAVNQHGSGGGPMSLREGLVGMIEEYARHMGHVDLLRERIDGRLGQ